MEATSVNRDQALGSTTYRTKAPPVEPPTHAHVGPTGWQVCAMLGHEPPHAGASLLSHACGCGSVVVVVDAPAQAVRHDAKSDAQPSAPLRAAAPQPSRQLSRSFAPLQPTTQARPVEATSCAHPPRS
jgi:hypothetical protein